MNPAETARNEKQTGSKPAPAQQAQKQNPATPSSPSQAQKEPEAANTARKEPGLTLKSG